MPPWSATAAPAPTTTPWDATAASPTKLKRLRCSGTPWRALKAVLDPRGILNPGVLFDPVGRTVGITVHMAPLERRAHRGRCFAVDPLDNPSSRPYISPYQLVGEACSGSLVVARKAWQLEHVIHFCRPPRA